MVLAAAVADLVRAREVVKAADRGEWESEGAASVGSNISDSASCSGKGDLVLIASNYSCWHKFTNKLCTIFSPLATPIPFNAKTKVAIFDHES